MLLLSILTSILALSSDDKEVLDRSITSKQDLPDDDLESFFEINRCVEWIKKLDLKNVALQFPDSLIRNSAIIAMEIEKRAEQRYQIYSAFLIVSKTEYFSTVFFFCRISILGDTSFGECCVDEVAAEHIGADGIIHFGKACLSPTRKLPGVFTI